MAYKMIFPLAMITTYIMTDMMIRYAHRLKLIDMPNHRSAHYKPTPKGGGLAVMIIFSLSLVYQHFCGLLASQFLWLLLGAIPIALLGLIDDMRTLSAKWRLLCQAVIVIVMLYQLHGFSDFDLGILTLHWGIVGSIIVAVGWLWLINLYNFMDGIDGLVVIEALTVIGGAVIQLLWQHHFSSEIIVMLILALCLSGFLLLNLAPAKIFLGDTGSSFLGYIFGLLLIVTVKQQQLTLFSWLILLSSFWVDATYTLLVRIATRQQWYSGHCSHLYQKLARQWASHSKVGLLTAAYNLLWLLPLSCMSLKWQSYGWLWLLFAILPIMSLCIQKKAGQIDAATT